MPGSDRITEMYSRDHFLIDYIVCRPGSRRFFYRGIKITHFPISFDSTTMQFPALLLAFPSVAAQTCIHKDYNTNNFVSVQGDAGANYIEGNDKDLAHITLFATKKEGKKKEKKHVKNACMSDSNGFKYDKKKNSKIKFTFAATVEAFSIQMWDFGDWNPKDFKSSSVIVTGYDAYGKGVASDKETVNGKPIDGTGDACAAEGSPGNRVFQLQGAAMKTVVISFEGTRKKGKEVNGKKGKGKKGTGKKGKGKKVRFSSDYNIAHKKGKKINFLSDSNVAFGNVCYTETEVQSETTDAPTVEVTDAPTDAPTAYAPTNAPTSAACHYPRLR